jgi:hypothetical protein
LLIIIIATTTTGVEFIRFILSLLTHQCTKLESISYCFFDWVAASKPKALGMVGKSHPQAALEAATHEVSASSGAACQIRINRLPKSICRISAWAEDVYFNNMFPFHFVAPSHGFVTKKGGGIAPVSNPPP